MNEIFQKATGSGVQAVSALGQAPGYVYERPIAVADTLAQKAGLGSPVAGIEKFVGASRSWGRSSAA